MAWGGGGCLLRERRVRRGRRERHFILKATEKGGVGLGKGASVFKQY